MGDEPMPSDPFMPAGLPDLNRLADHVAGFYTGLQARAVPEQRAAEFTTTFLQTWIPYLMMANSASQQQAKPQHRRG